MLNILTRDGFDEVYDIWNKMNESISLSNYGEYRPLYRPNLRSPRRLLTDFDQDGNEGNLLM